MTNSKPRRRRCPDCNRVLTAANHTPAMNTDYCDDCFDIAGLENEHYDGMHEEDTDSRCTLCTGQPIADRSKSSNVIVNKTAATSHADCDHAKTKAARAICRRDRRSAEIAGDAVARAQGI